MFSIFSFLLEDFPYTTEALLAEIAQISSFFQFRHKSVPFNPETCAPIREYLYSGDPDIPKKLCLAQDQLYRCQATGWLWESGENVTLDCETLREEEGRVLEIMNIQPYDFSWYRYQTAPVLPSIAPTPPSRLRFEKLGGKLVVTGVRDYCESLCIPAQIDGVPVDQVLLGARPETENLHTLVLEDGIRAVDFPWDTPSLTRIELSSAKLLSPPHGIRESRWFRQQTGQVYLGNYYCGTNGAPSSDTLILREGTIGVIDGADQHILWRKIIFPESVFYLGEYCFAFTQELPETVRLPAGKLALMDAFSFPGSSLVQPKVCLPEETCWEALKPLSPVGSFTGWDLYNAGRTNPFVRALIPFGWEPAIPRLDYTEDKGWVAHFWYRSEGSETPDGYAAIALPSCEPLDIQAPNYTASGRRTSVWTEDYETRFYLQGQEYLDHCAALIAKQEAPDEPTLTRLLDWHARHRQQPVCLDFSHMHPRLIAHEYDPEVTL